MSVNKYASAYYSGKVGFERWKQKHELEMSLEEAEKTLRQFLSIFKEMYPEQYEDILRGDSDARMVDKMYGNSPE